jgi:hypothetical protein
MPKERLYNITDFLLKLFKRVYKGNITAYDIEVALWQTPYKHKGKGLTKLER